MTKPYLNPCNDAAFKHLFGNPDNKDILLAMLNAILKSQLDKPLQDAVFLTPTEGPEPPDKATSIVDVQCQDASGHEYIIEIQMTHAQDFAKRSQYHAAKVFTQQPYEEYSYKPLKPVILLAFCYETIFAKDRHYRSDHGFMDKNTHEQDLDKIKYTFVDLVKFDAQRPSSLEALSLEEKFYYLLRHAEDTSDKDVAKLIGQDKAIKRAFDALERSNWPQEELLRYEEGALAR